MRDAKGHLQDQLIPVNLQSYLYQQCVVYCKLVHIPVSILYSLRINMPKYGGGVGGDSPPLSLF